MTKDGLLKLLLKEFQLVDEDWRYEFEIFVKHRLDMLYDAMKNAQMYAEMQTTVDPQVYFYNNFISMVILDLELATYPEDRWIIWGLWISKIADILLANMQVDVVYTIKFSEGN